MRFLIHPGGSLNGAVAVPGDKSISHRALILGAIAQGETRITHLLEGQDVLATLRALRQMGVPIECHNPGEYVIDGVGLHGLQQPRGDLELANSGTALRLLTGLMCAQAWPSCLKGDASLMQRPMRRIIQPLHLMGAAIVSRDDKPPLHVSPVNTLQGLHYTMPVASAQVKSCLLLAGLYAEGQTRVTQPAPTRDHTERLLQGFGYAVETDAARVGLSGGGTLQGCELTVPADLSSAAFFIVAGLIAKNSEIWLPGVGVNPSRDGVLSILQRMAADIEQHNRREVGGEPVADLRVRSSELCGCKIQSPDVALAIDEIPAIAVAAAVADGVTEIRQAEELRVKESDRIHSIVQGLSNLGVRVAEHADGLTIYGGKITGGVVHSFHDHRIAMAFSLAGLVSTAPVHILDCDNVATSFPDFAELAAQVGMNISVH